MKYNKEEAIQAYKEIQDKIDGFKLNKWIFLPVLLLLTWLVGIEQSLSSFSVFLLCIVLIIVYYKQVKLLELIIKLIPNPEDTEASN